ncbi:DUF3772 domain-containing protein [Oceaniglobus trochenteri]|uniref:DUF3772 domain-containing protein n=1 Tax=Oceaniglobus trochenteri TaxID=2763260 RepID=UPI001D000987|nr:DUF3772 domain-containing protein [Oceaniglobus trochenteri]
MIQGAPQLLRAFLLGVLVWLALAIAPLAQGEDDIAAWEALAERAEEILEVDRASDRRLEDLRGEIADYRETFLSAQGTNQTRITTLQAQISALGAPPGENDPPEADEIAARRAELEQQLARLEAPRRAAEEAYNRADGLIREIDRTIRERQTKEVLSRGPSPLNPAHWAPAFADLARSLDEWGKELHEGLTAPIGGQLLNADNAILLALAAIGMVMVLRGRVALTWLTRRFYVGWRGNSSPALAFIVSLGQVVVPVLGLALLATVGFASGLLGLRGQILAENLTGLGIVVFGAVWLGARVFPTDGIHDSPLPVRAERRRSGRFYAAMLGLLSAAATLLTRLVEFDNYSAETVSVLSFLVQLAGGAILFGFGRLLSEVGPPDPAPDDGEGESVPYFVTMLHLLGRASMVIGVIGPALAALGFASAGSLIVFGMIGSIALLALLAVMRLVVRDFYALVMRLDPQQAGEALTPVLISFLLAICALPLFALIWGARVTDLSELWARFREGFAIGDSRISPADFLSFAVVFAVCFMLTRLLQAALRGSVLPKTRLDTGGRNAIVAGTGYIGVFLAGIFAVTSAGIDLSSLAIVAGALSVGIGFGLQNIVSNFISGIILLVERPISEGDWIEVGGQMGYVRDISVRSTRIETFDRTDVIVPNADFVSGTVTNWTRGNLVGRVIVPVGVGYGSDTRKVEAILQEIAEAHPLVVLNPPPAVLFVAFGADSLNFEIRAILRDVNFVLSVKSDMNHEIAARFAAEGIEIPFAQRDIWLRNPEALHESRTGATGPAASSAPATQAPVSDRPYLTPDDLEQTGNATDNPDAGKDEP